MSEEHVRDQLEAIRAQLAAQQTEIARLQTQLDAKDQPRGSARRASQPQAARTPSSGGTLNRRWLLTGGAAVAMGGAAALLAGAEPAAAATGAMQYGATNDEGPTQTVLTGVPTTAGTLRVINSNVVGTNQGVVAIEALSGTLTSTPYGEGVIIGRSNLAMAGVFGDSTIGSGVGGFSGSYHGVHGNSDTSHGVYGSTATTTAGTSSVGVYGDGGSSHGVYGTTAAAAGAAVYGIYGQSANTTAIYATAGGASAAIFGAATANAPGVQAQSTTTAAPALLATNINGGGYAAIQGIASNPSGLLSSIGVGAVIGDTNVANTAGLVGASANYSAVIALNEAASSPALYASNAAGGIDQTATGSGRIHQVTQATVGAPNAASQTYLIGEQIRDANGQLWICVSPGTGSASSWQKVAAAAPGANGGSTNMLAAPFRLYDSRSGQPSTITTPKQQIQPGSGNTLALTAGGTGGIPPAAIGLIGTITITNTNGAGYLTVYPTGAAVPPTSNVNWTATGQTVAASYTCALNGGSVTILNGGSGPTDVILDIAGFVY